MTWILTLIYIFSQFLRARRSLIHLQYVRPSVLLPQSCPWHAEMSCTFLLLIIPQVKGALKRNRPSALPLQKALKTVMGTNRNTLFPGSLQLVYKILQTHKALSFKLHIAPPPVMAAEQSSSFLFHTAEENPYQKDLILYPLGRIIKFASSRWGVLMVHCSCICVINYLPLNSVF